MIDVLDPEVTVPITANCPIFREALGAREYSTAFVIESMDLDLQQDYRRTHFDPKAKESKEDRELTKKVTAFVAVRETTTIYDWYDEKPGLFRRIWNRIRGKKDD